MRKIGGRGLLLAFSLCAGLLGCSSKSRGLEDLDVGLGGSTGIGGTTSFGGTTGIGTKQIEDILKALFPDLTPEEIHELAASLSLEAAVALKAELEEVRKEAERFSRELFTTAEERVETRSKALEPENKGFPKSLQPVGRAAFYSSAKGEGTILLNGVFSNQTPVLLEPSEVSVSVAGGVQASTLKCLRQQSSVDIVFLVDITGSMSPVIKSVRASLGRFVEAIVASGIQGTIGVVTFQDTVGVNVSFQQSSPGVERSPFFSPVPISDAVKVAELQRFIARLEANQGADAPENLAGALDFARNNVIGYTTAGTPNVIGSGGDDPKATKPWPALTSEQQVFAVFTDITFHSDSRTTTNSSLKSGFKPRKIADILQTLQTTGSVVHVSDPSWVDKTTSPTGASDEREVDADFWAMQTSGLGEDRVLGYSLVDLELVVVAKETGLLDITLDSILATSCSVRFPLTSLTAGGTFSLRLEHAGEVFSEELVPIEL